MKLFLQKHAKFSSPGGFARRPPCLRRPGALPPNPQPPAAGGFAFRPHWPPAAGGSAPRPPKQPPHCEFLVTRLLVAKTSSFGPKNIFCQRKKGVLPPHSTAEECSTLWTRFSSSCKQKGQLKCLCLEDLSNLTPPSSQHWSFGVFGSQKESQKNLHLGLPPTPLRRCSHGSWIVFQ